MLSNEKFSHSSARWEGLRKYFFSDFPWNDYCFRSETPPCVPSFLQRRSPWMEAHVPHIFSLPWLSCTCSRAIKDGEATQKRYLSPPTPDNHILYIFTQNRNKSTYQKIFSSMKTVKILPILILEVSGILQKIFSRILLLHPSLPFFIPDGTTSVTSISKAELFAQTFSKNSDVDDSGHIPPIEPHAT